VRTAIVSDLHLGIGSGADLLRRPDMLDRLLAEVAGADRLVLLGDVLELRDRPLPEVLENAAPVMAALGEAMAGGEVVVVAGNHDHHLIEPWLERRALEGGEELGLEQAGAPEGLAFEAFAEQAGGGTAVRFAYPGLWLREDVYALHGHYLDRHLTVPTIERLGVAAIERVLGIPPTGPDPLDIDQDGRIDVDEYERVQTPVYALLFGLAQATVGDTRGGADPSMRLWQMMGGGESRTARLRGWLLGSVAVPGAVGVANRLGLGPVRSDLSAGAIGRAGFDALGDVIENLQIRASHVIFGHTHRRGGPERRGEASLWNTGSWVHSPGLIGETAATSPYWPGTVCWVGDDGDPELVHLLDGLGREELAAG
jgi:predicted phosphodiesterase